MIAFYFHYAAKIVRCGNRLIKVRGHRLMSGKSFRKKVVFPDCCGPVKESIGN